MYEFKQGCLIPLLGQSEARAKKRKAECVATVFCLQCPDADQMPDTCELECGYPKVNAARCKRSCACKVWPARVVERGIGPFRYLVVENKRLDAYLWWVLETAQRERIAQTQDAEVCTMRHNLQAHAFQTVYA